jgi:single-stranded DNA-binding protein
MIDAYKDVVKKGSLCHVQGRLRTDTWGEENSKFRLVIEANTVSASKQLYASRHL